MELKPITTIDEIIGILEDIIIETTANNDPKGYFAVLYQKVTKKVKEGVEQQFFEDGARMATLDVVFAKRYIDAYYAFHKGETITQAWRDAFELSAKYWPIVLQHLLVGMNAHINLDLGIAAANVSRDKNIDDLQADFNKINEILAQLVNEVQEDLARVWPTLKKILRMTKKIDDFLIDFSMELARDGAWRFAKSLATKPIKEQEILIGRRDKKVATQMKIITNPGLIARIVLAIIRLSEKGPVSKKIQELRKTENQKDTYPVSTNPSS